MATFREPSHQLVKASSSGRLLPHGDRMGPDSHVTPAATGLLGLGMRATRPMLSSLSCRCSTSRLGTAGAISQSSVSAARASMHHKTGLIGYLRARARPLLASTDTRRTTWETSSRWTTLVLSPPRRLDPLQDVSAGNIIIADNDDAGNPKGDFDVVMNLATGPTTPGEVTGTRPYRAITIPKQGHHTLPR